MINFCSAIIRYSFYAIFLLVPLVFAGNTSELFEFNKMWLTFILTIIVGLAWGTKIILNKKFSIQRTPLDIPLLLFLLSQIISTIFSLDPHVSWWGYYSRFNGGLLSTICYVILYYALVSNLSYKNILSILKATLIGGVITALWGLPSHFGFDPTCLVFRGTLDTTCWTDAFRPTIRVFSTLGQPAWFAAYLAVLIPISAAYALKQKINNHLPYAITYLIISVLFYLNLIFANTRAGFIAFIVANIIFWAVIYIKKLFSTKIFIRFLLTFNVILLTTNFLFGIPIENLYKYTLPGFNIQASTPKTITTQTTPTSQIVATTPTVSPTPEPVAQTNQANITDSGTIRLYVWRGAIDAWKSNALFGTGVETFAFAYYLFRPTGHNLTSEWDYLYNKAHNEYLNYLTTTGIFGLGTYLLFIGLFIFLNIKWLLTKNKEQKTSEKNSIPYTLNSLLITGLFTGWFSILISNFFGFSVVIMNLFLFLIPAFALIINDSLNPEKIWKFAWGQETDAISPYQWTIIILLNIFAIYLLTNLSFYWYADTKYALGANLDRVGSYQQAYPLLLTAAQTKPNEPVFKDELAINVAVLATALAAQKDQTNASQFANNAITLNNEVVTAHPNNVVYWKNRVRIFYTLAQAVDPTQQQVYYQEALKAIQKASELAPTDAKIIYNLGVLYGQTGNIEKGIEVLQQAIKLKPDYRDPYFALGLFYHQLAVDKNNYVTNPAMQQKAIEIYQYMLTHFNPNDEEVKKSLSEWGVK